MKIPTHWFLVMVLTTCANPLIAQSLDGIKMPPAAREVCHIVQFKDGWGKLGGAEWELPRYQSRDDYEFRSEGAPGSRFLVRGYFSVGIRYYTANTYSIDLSDGAGKATLVNLDRWNAAVEVEVVRRDPVATRTFANEFRQFDLQGFEKTGERWASKSSLLSPDGSWMVLQSYTGTLAVGLGPFQGTRGRDRGKVFFDIYNFRSVTKRFTIEGRYNDDHPNGFLKDGGWLAERYFVIGFGSQRERMLVCNLGPSRNREGVR